MQGCLVEAGSVGKAATAAGSLAVAVATVAGQIGLSQYNSYSSFATNGHVQQGLRALDSADGPTPKFLQAVCLTPLIS